MSETSNVSDGTIREAQAQYAADKHAVEECTAVLRVNLKRFKKLGVNTKMIIAAHNLSRLGLDNARAEMAETIHYGSLLGLNFTDLLDGIAQSTEGTPDFIAAEQGYLAGKIGSPVDDNPYEVGSENHAAFARGWHRGKSFADKHAPPHVKQASAERGKPGRPKGSKNKPKQIGMFGSTGKKNGPGRSSRRGRHSEDRQAAN